MAQGCLRKREQPGAANLPDRRARLILKVGGWDFALQTAYGAPTDKKDRMWLVILRIRIRIFIFPQPLCDKTLHVRGEIQMIPESAYKSSPSKN